MNFILVGVILFLIIKGVIDKRYYKFTINSLKYELERYKEMTDTLCKRGDNIND
ncbi:hypothetical protein [Clostridium baratii]|uniref:Uncharacterized protein n=1 Tax=Clostridium baratii TaxID=1561 RepID=A0A174QVB4_9CLOT|nr:hypothetical protein [Clostridium baratii]CUP74828.1 Uncharacterised protein [Clostridium baratii]